jgi:hypothetical protein
VDVEEIGREKHVDYIGNVARILASWSCGTGRGDRASRKPFGSFLPFCIIDTYPCFSYHMNQI